MGASGIFHCLMMIQLQCVDPSNLLWMLLLRSQFVQMFGTLMLPMTLEKKLCPSMMTLV